ncbi:MAG: SMP-30/gluconolactonase/LRE family protein [Gammaproteobacteria bacterium]
MKASLKVFLTILMASLCQTALAHNENLKKLWETDGFKTPESVVYDEANDVLYVSNVNGAPGDKDGNGFISRVSLDGEILELEWVTGMDAPKGLAIVGNKLYVSDIDTLVEINIDGGAITNRYQAEDGQFFNDVAASADGDVYVSDTGTNTIHRLSNGSFGVWLQNDELDGPNGLLVEKDRLVVASIGPFGAPDPSHLFAVSLGDKAVSKITPEPAGKLDGLEADLDGDYYVTDWVNGGLLHIYPDGHVEELLDLDQGSADLEYIAAKDMILIPMMMNDKLVAWQAHSLE